MYDLPWTLEALRVPRYCFSAYNALIIPRVEFPSGPVPFSWKRTIEQLTRSLSIKGVWNRRHYEVNDEKVGHIVQRSRNIPRTPKPDPTSDGRQSSPDRAKREVERLEILRYHLGVPLVTRVCFLEYIGQTTGNTHNQTPIMSMYQGVMYAAAPPPGVTPNPDEPHQATALVVVTGIFLPLAVISMAIRVYTRAIIVSKVAFDDCK